MNKYSFIIFVTVFGMCINFAIAGPFGLDMGISLKQIDENAKQVGPGVYITEKVPMPHSAFVFYALKIGANCGLCWIKALGKDISTSSYGIELRSKFKDMKEKLEKVYGRCETKDFLMPGSIWKEPNDFMMALIKKERFLMAVWTKGKGAYLKENLTQIALIANPRDTDEGYLSVEYFFSNNEACDKEIASQEDGAL